MKIHEPAMTFASDEAEGKWALGLANNQDPYGNAVYRFASEWATRMEAGLNKGAALEDIADDCGRAADDEGITGFMYGAAVSVLSQAWRHGDALRRWHNLKMQIGTEGERANDSGGVLNPALLNVGEEA